MLKYHFDLKIYTTMITLFVLGSFLVFSEANPQSKVSAGLGYDYKPPATSYGVPSGSVSFNSQHYNLPSSTLSIGPGGESSLYASSTLRPFQAGTNTPLLNTYGISPAIFSSTSSSDFQIPVHDFTPFTHNIQAVGNIPIESDAFARTGLNRGRNINNQRPDSLSFRTSLGSLTNNENGVSESASLNLQNPIANQAFQNRYNIETVNQEGEVNAENGEPQIEVSRHLYFFSSPENIAVPRQRINLPGTPTKQNVKILFIKAPSLVTPPPISIPAQKQNEEKTVVYVLVKKPEEPAPIEVNTPAPTPPSQPEVFFIKYKTQKEVEKAVADIQREHQQDTNGKDITGVTSNSGISLSANPVLHTVPLSQLRFSDNNQDVGNIGNIVAQLQSTTTTDSPLGYSSSSSTENSYSSETSLPYSANSIRGSQYTAFLNDNVQPDISYNAGEFAPVQEHKNQSPLISSLINVPKLVNTQIGPNDSNQYEINKEGVLSESFGGVNNNLPSESETTNSVVLTSSRVNGISNDVMPHTTYGVPNKRELEKFNF